MNDWMRKIIATLAGVVAVAILVRLAWELLRPVLPALIAIIVVVVILRLIFRRRQGW
jgi:hypothetical protein